MPNYGFETLNDKEFENLSRDLLQAEHKITLESFKRGRDQGIDLRYISPVQSKDKIIIQAKHWRKSGLKQLINKLRKEELPKVIKLSPSRYILTTSVELSPSDKDTILNIFKPFIRFPADIYGKDDLNNLLGKFPKIEKSWHKLWLSSVNILQKIVNNGIEGRSEFVVESIRKNISLYVQNEKFNQALRILNKKRFLVIIGEPGIGKTVLARMLTYNLLASGYQLISVDEKISEAEKLWEPGKKQVFYFDDFLGSNYFEILQPKNSDSALINFIERVKEDPMKRLILTSRTTILNQATQNLSKLQNPKIELSKHEVNINDYSEWNRALILYNHLYFSKLSERYLKKIIEKKNYWKIIKHKNFNPRLIEFITEPLRLLGVKDSEYLTFIMKNLDDPSLIWENPYEKQIDDYARFLISTLFSLDTVEEKYLQDAFESRLSYEIKNGFQRKSSIFHIKIKELSRGFIIHKNNGQIITYDFFNPSIIDFFINYLLKNPGEKWRILESSIYTEQLTTRFGISFGKRIVFDDNELDRLHQLIQAKRSALKIIKGGSKEVEIIYFYYLLFDISKIEKDVVEIFREIKLNEVNSSQAHSLLNLLEEFAGFSILKDAILENWRNIIDTLFQNAYEEEELLRVLELFETYSQDYEQYISNEISQEVVEESLDYYWQIRIDAITSKGSEVRSLFKPSQIKDHVYNIHNDAEKFNEEFGVYDLKVLEKLFEINAEEIADDNSQNARAEDAIADIQQEEYKFRESNEVSRIDELFVS